MRDPQRVRSEDFHVVVKQEGELKLVPAGGAVPFPPRVEEVYALFSEEVEGMIWNAPFSAVLEPGPGGTNETATRVHRLRSEGDSEWDKGWAVEVDFEELPGGWLSPTEIRYEGLAVYVPIGRVFERGVENNEAVFKELV